MRKFLAHETILQSHSFYAISCSHRAGVDENQTHSGMLNYKID